MIGLPVLRPVERRGAQAGTRGQGGDGGRVGLVGLGQRRPGGRAVLLRVRQRTTAQDSVTHGATALLRAAAICCRVSWRGGGGGVEERGLDVLLQGRVTPAATSAAASLGVSAQLRLRAARPRRSKGLAFFFFPKVC